MITKIVNRFSGSVIFEAEVDGATASIRLGLAARLAARAGANLVEADLTQADLTRADLARADLTQANLTRTNLTGANLTRTNLTRANLVEADLTQADLTRADLARADLTRANLTRTNLTGANLTRTNLTGANLTGANLDFSSGITLRCSSFGFRCDFRLIAQLMCHIARLESDDPRAKEIIEEVRRRWGNDFCKFRSDVNPGNWS